MIRLLVTSLRVCDDIKGREFTLFGGYGSAFIATLLKDFPILTPEDTDALAYVFVDEGRSEPMTHSMLPSIMSTKTHFGSSLNVSPPLSYLRIIGALNRIQRQDLKAFMDKLTQSIETPAESFKEQIEKPSESLQPRWFTGQLSESNKPLRLSRFLKLVQDHIEADNGYALDANYTYSPTASTSTGIYLEAVGEVNFISKSNTVDVSDYMKNYKDADPQVFFMQPEFDQILSVPVPILEQGILPYFMGKLDDCVDVRTFYHWLNEFDRHDQGVVCIDYMNDFYREKDTSKVIVIRGARAIAHPDLANPIKLAGGSGAHFQNTLSSALEKEFFDPGSTLMMLGEESFMTYADLDKLRDDGVIAADTPSVDKQVEYVHKEHTPDLLSTHGLSAYPGISVTGVPELFVGYKQPQPESNTEMNETEQPQKQLRLNEFLKMVAATKAQNHELALKSDFILCPWAKSDAENIYLVACDITNFVTRTNQVCIKSYKEGFEGADPLVFFVSGHSKDVNIRKHVAAPVTSENMSELFMGSLADRVTATGLYKWLSTYDASVGNLIQVCFYTGVSTKTYELPVVHITGMRVVHKDPRNGVNANTILQHGGSAEYFKTLTIALGQYRQPIEPDKTFIMIEGGSYLTYGDLDKLHNQGKIGGVVGQHLNNASMHPPFTPFPNEGYNNSQWMEYMNHYMNPRFTPRFDPAKAMGFPGMQAQPLMQRPFVFQGEFGQQPTELKNCIHVVFNDASVPAVVLQRTSDDGDNAYAMIAHFLKKNVLKSYVVYGDDGQITQQVTVS
jgi:hypothetical protein